jgi:hypothetical protein
MQHALDWQNTTPDSLELTLWANDGRKQVSSDSKPSASI